MKGLSARGQMPWAMVCFLILGAHCQPRNDGGASTHDPGSGDPTTGGAEQPGGTADTGLTPDSGGASDSGPGIDTGQTDNPEDGPVLELVSVPDPLSEDNPRYVLLPAGVPAAGDPVCDPRFGTTQTRRLATEGLRHEYSRFDPFNRDGSMVLLHHLSTGEWRVYRTGSEPYDDDGNLVRTVDLAELRWDPAVAGRLWGLRDFHLLTLDVDTGDSTLIKDFSGDPAIAPLLAANPDLYRVTTRDEGEPSLDRRYWAFMLQGMEQDYRPRYVFSWDREEDRVTGIFELAPGVSRIDWVGMSPLGRWVILGADWDNGGGLSGMVIANRELTWFHQIDYDAGHSDVGLDSTGREVIVLQSNRTDHIEMLPLSPDTRPIDTGGSYEDTGRVRLIRLFYSSQSPLSLNSGIHISCNAPGWSVVSTFTEPGLPEQNWLDRTITLVRLDARQPKVYYLAKVYGTSGAYWEETQATISADGSRIVWASNWNRDVGLDRVWLMQLNLPAGWIESVGRTP